MPAPESWRAATMESERIEQAKTENSRLHQEILLRLQDLNLSTAVWSANLCVREGVSPWNLWADFSMKGGNEKGAKLLAVDIDTLNRGTNRYVKMKRFQQLGYQTLTLKYTPFRFLYLPRSLV